MRILLLACNPVVAPYPVYPLGMSVIAAALTRAGHAVRQFDMLAAGFSIDSLRAAIAACDPGLVGWMRPSIRTSPKTETSGWNPGESLPHGS